MKKAAKKKKRSEIFFGIPFAILAVIYFTLHIINKNNVWGWIILMAVLVGLYLIRRFLLKIRPIAAIAIWIVVALLLVIPFGLTLSPDVPSLQSRIFLQFLKATLSSQSPVEGADKLQFAQEQRAFLENLSKKYKLPKDIIVEEVKTDGVSGEWVYKKEAPADKVILYIHGGAFISGSTKIARVFSVSLARVTGVKVFSIDYRLAPENPFPAALEDALKAYHWLLAQGFSPSSIVMAGESAGGNLTLTTALALKEKKEPLPAALIVNSPVTDLLFSGETQKTKKKDDPILGKTNTTYLNEMYIGKDLSTETDRAILRNPLLSPLYGDLRGLPPVLIHVGSNEILLDHSTRFAKAAKAAGVDVTLKIWNGMWHTFQFMESLPESRRSVQEMGAFARKHLGFANSTN